MATLFKLKVPVESINNELNKLVNRTGNEAQKLVNSLPINEINQEVSKFLGSVNFEELANEPTKKINNLPVEESALSLENSVKELAAETNSPELINVATNVHSWNDLVDTLNQAFDETKNPQVPSEIINPSDELTAVEALNLYRGSFDETLTSLIPSNFQDLNVAFIGERGFNGNSFFDSENSELVVVLGATDKVSDFDDNLALVSDQLPNQFEDALKFINDNISYVQDNYGVALAPEDITLVGYSLGGSLGALASAYTDYQAVTFNAPGVTGLLDNLENIQGDLIEPGDLTSQDLSNFNVYNYNVANDWIANINEPIGIEIVLPASNLQNPHSLDAVYDGLTAMA